MPYPSATLYPGMPTYPGFDVPVEPSPPTAPPPPSSTYLTEVIQDHPLSWWRLGELTGSILAARDEYDNNPMTYISNPGLGSPGLINDGNPAVTLNGVDQFVIGPDKPSLDLGNGPQSLELWVKLLAPPATYAYFIAKAFQDQGYRLRYTPGFLEYGNENFALALAPVTLTVGKTYHIVATWEPLGRQSRLYVNAVRVDKPELLSTILSDRSLVFKDSNAGLIFGVRYTVDQFFNGTIDEVAIYRQVLEPSRVQAHYLAGINIPVESSTRRRRYFITHVA